MEKLGIYAVDKELFRVGAVVAYVDAVRREREPSRSGCDEEEA